MRSLYRIVEGLLDIDDEVLDKIDKRIEEMISFDTLLRDHIMTMGYSRGLGYTHYDKIVSGIKQLRKEHKIDPFVNIKGKQISQAKDLCNALASICNMVSVSLTDTIEQRKSYIEASLNDKLKQYLPGIKCDIEWGNERRILYRWGSRDKMSKKKAKDVVSILLGDHSKYIWL